MAAGAGLVSDNRGRMMQWSLAVSQVIPYSLFGGIGDANWGGQLTASDHERRLRRTNRPPTPRWKSTVDGELRARFRALSETANGVAQFTLCDN
jgi:hypothetical protein